MLFEAFHILFFSHEKTLNRRVLMCFFATLGKLPSFRLLPKRKKPELQRTDGIAKAHLDRHKKQQKKQGDFFLIFSEQVQLRT